MNQYSVTFRCKNLKEDITEILFLENDAALLDHFKKRSCDSLLEWEQMK